MQLSTPSHLAGFLRPEKISWDFPELMAGEQWIEKVPSKSIRKLASKKDDLLNKHSIQYSLYPLTFELFTNWHSFYVEIMTLLGHDIFATLEWFDKNSNQDKELWLLDYVKDGERVGGSIVSSSPTIGWTHHFKASSRIDLPGEKNISLGMLMELKFIDAAFSSGANRVSSGLSRNGFGYFNALGYLVSKLRMGYLPLPSARYGRDQNYQVVDEHAPTVWFIFDNDDVRSALLHPDTSAFSQEIISYFQRQNIPTLHFKEH